MTELDEALGRIQTILRNVTDHSQIPKLRSKAEKDASESRKELQLTLDNILLNLNLNADYVKSIKETANKYSVIDFKNYYDQIKNFREFVNDYDSIEKLVVAHRNMRKSLEMQNKLENLDCKMNAFLEKINKWKNESTFIEKMCTIFEDIYNIEELKCFIGIYLQNLNRRIFLTARHKIDIIDRVLLEFSIGIMLVATSFLEDNRFNTELIQNLTKYIIIEELRDEITIKVNHRNDSDEINKEMRSAYPQYSNRKLTKFKNKFEDALKGGIRSRFDRIRNSNDIINLDPIFNDIDKISALSDNSDSYLMQFIANSEEDLTSNSSNSPTKDSDSDLTNKSSTKEMTECTEKTLKSKNEDRELNTNSEIFDTNIEHEFFGTNFKKLLLKFYKTENLTQHTIDWDEIKRYYHSQLRIFIKEKIVDPRDILYILEFVTKYYAVATARFKIPREKLGVDILEENQDDLVQRYISNTITSIEDFVSELTKREVERFYLRSSPPLLDEDEKYISESFINLLQMVKEQLNPVSFNKHIFSCLTKEILLVCEMFTKDIKRAMTKELEMALRDKAKEGYEEFVIMLGNSGLKVTQYISALPQPESDEIGMLGNLFLDITKKSNTCLSTFIINTCKKPLDLIYTNSWYDEDKTRVVIVTIDDFLIDYQQTMNEFMFITFCYELINELVKFYFKQISRKRAKIYEDCGYRIERDIKSYRELFIKYTAEEEVDNLFQPLLKVCPLLGSNTKDIFVLELKSLLLVCPDMKREFIKAIIAKKEDLKDSEKRAYNEAIKDCFKDIKTERKTIFSSLKF